MKYKILRRILDGQDTVGYQVIAFTGEKANISRQDTIRLAQADLLINATYNKSTGMLSGINNTDLRTIPTVQYSDVARQIIKVDPNKTSETVNQNKAKEYLLQYKNAGKQPLLSLELLPNDKVRLVRVNDKESTGRILIPSFVTDILTRDQAHYYDKESPFKGCKFTQVGFDNQQRPLNLQGVFSEMQSKSLSIAFRHPECISDVSELFYMCEQVEQIDISRLKTPHVKDAHGMFKMCRRLKYINFGSFDTSQVTDMSEMFNWCASLETLDLSTFKTSNVKDMHSMFDRCMVLKQLNIGSFNTSSVLYMQAMFNQCTSIEDLDISNFDTTNVRDISTMFYGCRSLARLKHRINIQMASQTYDIFDDCDRLSDSYKIMHQ